MADIPNTIYVDYSGGQRGNLKVAATENRWHDDLRPFYHIPDDLKERLREWMADDAEDKSLTIWWGKRTVHDLLTIIDP